MAKRGYLFGLTCAVAIMPACKSDESYAKDETASATGCPASEVAISDMTSSTKITGDDRIFLKTWTANVRGKTITCTSGDGFINTTCSSGCR